MCSIVGVDDRKKLLIIDDDENLNSTLKRLFEPTYDVATALDGNEGLRRAHSFRPDAILLDIKMPNPDGFEVCERLRSDAATSSIPVLFLSGLDDSESRTRAFQCGGDDFIGKPFHWRELMLRVNVKVARREIGQNALARRATAGASEENPVSGSQFLECGNLVLDLDRIEASVSGKKVELSVLAFELLKLFVLNREKILSRARILELLWSGETVVARTVDAHVCGLRKQLSKCDYSLETVHGVGYIFRQRSPSFRRRRSAKKS